MADCQLFCNSAIHVQSRNLPARDQTDRSLNHLRTMRRLPKPPTLPRLPFPPNDFRPATYIPRNRKNRDLATPRCSPGDPGLRRSEEERRGVGSGLAEDWWSEPVEGGGGGEAEFGVDVSVGVVGWVRGWLLIEPKRSSLRNRRRGWVAGRGF